MESKYFRVRERRISNNTTGPHTLRSLYSRAVLRGLIALLFIVFLAACEPSGENRLSIISGGDCLLDRYGGESSVSAQPDARWVFLAHAAEESDAVLVNLETAVGSAGTGGSPKSKRFVFRAPPGRLDPLAKFTRPIVALANNHSLDYGPEGLIETINELDRRGIAHSGGGRMRFDAFAPVAVEADGMTARILSFGFDNEPESYSEKAGSCIAPLNLKQMQTAIASNRASADLVIVMLHWGQEYEPRRSGYQEDVAHFLIDAGADAVLGTGPHVLQGIELYHGSLICYSLGNLVFDDLGNAETTASILVRVTRENHGGHEINRFAILPLRTRDIVHGPREPSPEDALAIIRAIALRSPDPSILSRRPTPSKRGVAWFRIRGK